MNINDNHQIIIDMVPINNCIDSKLKIEVFLDNGEKLVDSIYVINNEYGSFISPFSYDDAREYYFQYAINNNILTEEECAKIRNDILKESCIESVLVDKKISNIDNVNAIYTNAISTATSYTVQGSLIWRDDDFSHHQLRGVKVELHNKTLVGSTVIETDYTDNSGRFEFDIGNFESEDIFIRVYPGDDNIVIKHGVLNTQYYWDSSITENVSFGDDITISNIFTMSSDCGRAFQISQALITARNYAAVMSGVTPSDVKVKYPQSETCWYSSPLNTIYITGDVETNDFNLYSYSSWDTIMHEYGHHIQYEMDIIDNPGGDHMSNKNHADVLQNKDKGIRLAWAESWPTVFAVMAQQYYSSILTNINTVGDSRYTAYNNPNYDLNSEAARLGEACEQSIMGVLWDIYDDDDEDGDNLALGHQAFWDVTTESESTTFSDFIEHFYQTYPNYVNKLGPILSYYKMATSKPIVTNASSVSQTIPPTFSWTAQGGSTEYPNNRFRIIVYNVSNNVIFESSIFVDTTYTFTQAEWNTILNSYGTTFTVAIAALQTHSPTTGEYISERSEVITKPTPSTLNRRLRFDTALSYYEKEEQLQPSQSVKYQIKFPTEGTRILQTFGQKDTRIFLYDNSGNLIVSNDDSGYNSNALISYNFDANIVYNVEVKFFSYQQAGKLKFSVTPAWGALKSGVSSIQKYEDIYAVTSSTSFAWSTYLDPYYSKAITFTPPESGNYTFELTGELDTYIYIIDPRSTEMLEFGVDYDDNSGVDDNAKLTISLDANVPYLVVYSTYDPSTLPETTYVVLSISKN